MKVAVNDFVKRQTELSGKTFSNDLTFEFFANHARDKMIKNEFLIGYRKGVRIVTIDKKYVHKVFCPYVKITKDIKLVSKLVKRKENELPYIQTRAINGIPVKAGSVDLILYSHKVLLENDENTTDADWELVSINAIPDGEDTMPIAPVTMMRNQLNLAGGTKALYSTEEWAKSVQFWQKYASLNPVNSIDED
tara:strand:- start:37 stop:615 length:579 start_codon:yes stop_codon:yes gene_type:complete